MKRPLDLTIADQSRYQEYCDKDCRLSTESSRRLSLRSSKSHLLRRVLIGGFRAVTLSALLTCSADCHAQSHGQLLGHVVVPGEATDLFPGTGVNTNRLGGFSSGLHYDRVNNLYYGVADRGAGGGAYSYETRIQQFTMDTDLTSGAISNFTLQKTIPLRTADGSAAFNGLNPTRLNGNPGLLGLSLDPEAMAVGPNGHFFFADEYGPSIVEFAPVEVGGKTEARFVRSFNIPNNLLPRDSSGAINYDAVRVPTAPDLALVSGRQESRGFEGVTITGNSLWATLQGPLAEEGASSEGRRSRNTRLVEFDLTTGESKRQLIYQLEDRASVNAVIATMNPDPAAAFGGTAQGRSLVISEMLALNDHEFLMIERDNRGFGSENVTGNDPILSAVGLKHVYRVNINGATDVSNISLKGTNSLTTPVLAGNPDPPIDIVPVTKTSFLDIRSALLASGLPIPEKIEGITFGPQLNNGMFAFIIGSDNDYSVTQAGTVVGGGGERLPVQYEIYNRGSEVLFTPLDNKNVTYVNILDTAAANYLVDQGPLPAGFAPQPSYLYSFAAIPEPATGLLAIVASVCLMGLRTRSRQ